MFDYKKRGICGAVILLMMIFGPAPGAQAQDCSVLRTIENTKLNDFMQKKLSFEISNKTRELIETWRGEYTSPDLLDALWRQVNARIDRERIAAEQAEVIYLQALADRENGCSDGQ